MTYVYKEYKQEEYVQNKSKSLKFALILAKTLGFKTIDVVVSKGNGIVKGFAVADNHILNAIGCYKTVPSGVNSMGLEYMTTDIKRISVNSAEELLTGRGYTTYEDGEKEALELFITKIWKDKVKEKEWEY